jgi:SAM-dependent methyltransferase
MAKHGRRNVWRHLRNLPAYLNFRREFALFRAMAVASGARLPVYWRDRYPCLRDKTGRTGFDHHYLYHTAWAARAVAKIAPPSHVDIGSSLYFCALVSAFVPFQFYDIRPPDLKLPNLENAPADITQLPFADASVPSLSCMHVVEHVGLGRYGDALDPDGDLKAIAELKRVLAPGGSLLFVVPVGRARIAFNAHRIYSYGHVTKSFADLSLIEFALIPDDREAKLIADASGELADAQDYGCGCFWFRRPT